jgi:hypothetical protein
MGALAAAQPGAQVAHRQEEIVVPQPGAQVAHHLVETAAPQQQTAGPAVALPAAARVTAAVEAAQAPMVGPQVTRMLTVALAAVPLVLMGEAAVLAEPRRMLVQ